MTIIDIRNAVRQRIAEQMQASADRITSGSCKDYAEYRQAVGRISGGRDALDAVDTVFHKLMDDEGE